MVVVVAVIAALATIALFSISAARAKANDVARIKELNDVHGALMLYYADHRKYPQIPQACVQTDDDDDPSTSRVDDDSPKNSPGLVNSLHLTSNPTEDERKDFDVSCKTKGFKQFYQNASDPSDYGCSGDGHTDTKICGWAAHGGVSPYQAHEVAGGSCSGAYLNKAGIGSAYEALSGSDPIDPDFPSSGKFSTPDFQQSYSGDWLDDSGAGLLDILFKGGYLNRKTWGVSTGNNDQNVCRYVVDGEQNLDESNGQPPWDGNVQGYLLFCDLETLKSNEVNDGGLNPNVYEIYSPGDRKICVTGTGTP